MINTKEISSGENLKKIRRELGLRQHEIVGDEVTRNLVSLIENNKSPLYYTIAKVIATNINKLADERNMDVFISPEDIMEPKRMEAKRKANAYIGELRECIKNRNYKLNEEYVGGLEDFLKRWSIPEKKVIIYELLGYIAYFKNDTEGEYLYLTRALENYFMKPVKKNIYKLVVRLIKNCIHTNRNNEAIRLSNLDFMENYDLPDKYKATIAYNRALAYKGLKRYGEALEILDRTHDIFGQNYREYAKSLVLQGTCYSKTEEQDKAIKKYEEVVGDFRDKHEEVAKAYSNLMEIHRDMDSRLKVVKYRDKLFEILPDFRLHDRQLLDIYISLARTDEYLGEYQSAEYYYVKAFNESIETNNTSRLANIVLMILNLYNKVTKEDRIFMSDYIFKKFFEKVDLTDDVKLVFRLILIYLESGRKEEVKGLIHGYLEYEKY